MTKKRLRSVMGENIRNERISRSISMDELAELVGMTPGFIGLIERGQRGATPSTLLKLSDVFGLTIDSFFYPRENSALSLGEEPTNKNKAKRKKIESLVADFNGEELDFVISMLKGVRFMNRLDEEIEDYMDEEEDE